MAIIKLFASIAAELRRHPQRLHSDSLDKLASTHQDYAYVGNRKSLKQEVLRLADQLQRKLSTYPNLAVEWKFPLTSTESDWAAWWYGRNDWDTNSGVFPDFVLGWVPDNIYGNGALVELKDSEGAGIASFNSTLPTAQKSLNKLSNLVKNAIRRYDLPFSMEPIYPDYRDCFYLVRTHSRNTAQVRLSIVQGTFFETITTQDLLSAMWEQLLSEAGLTPDKSQEIIETLRSLDRDSIAITRRIENASIKPRFRIMAEVEADGNPHHYTEIPARSVNLIVKPPAIDWEHPITQIRQWFEETEVQIVGEKGKDSLTVFASQQLLDLQWRIVQHRRNGKHLVIQTTLQAI